MSGPDPEVVYLDNAASTRCDPRVVDVVVSHHLEHYANPSAAHAAGRRSAAAVEHAREHVRALVASSLPAEDTIVVFTSGATEANNIALHGLSSWAPERRRIVTSAVEHPSVLAPLDALVNSGFEIVRCGVDACGRVDVDHLAELVDERTALVTVQFANNEVGTRQPVDRVAAIAHEAGAYVHCDAAQAVGKVSVDLGVLGIDSLSLSGGKFHGPKGTGALVVRRELRPLLMPLMRGGGQEGGIRSGTHDVPGIAGLGAAARIAVEDLDSDAQRIGRLRDLLKASLLEALPGLELNGCETCRVPGILSVALPVGNAGLVLQLAPNVAASTSSACCAGTPSHVLAAMGLDDGRRARTLRLSLGRFSTEQDVRTAVDSIAAAVARIQGTPGAEPSSAVGA